MHILIVEFKENEDFRGIMLYVPCHASNAAIFAWLCVL